MNAKCVILVGLTIGLLASCENGSSDDCDSHQSSACYQGDVYWYDSCGEREDVKENCQDAGCNDGKCGGGCISRASSECYDGDVYWYDSCGERGEEKEDCQDAGCNDGKCGGGCISRASSDCDDGDVYWYDSCGERGEKKEDCQDAGCSNGQCDSSCNPDDSPRCRESTEIVEVCTNSGWQDEQDCSENADLPYCLSGECVECRPGMSRCKLGSEIVQTCQTGSWTESEDCADLSQVCRDGQCVGPDGVECNHDTCSVEQVCCMLYPPECTEEDYCYMSYAACDENDDCIGSGEVCCIDSSDNLAKAVCQAEASCDRQVCQTAADCPGDWVVCCDHSILKGIKFCFPMSCP
jgi:hypothetical protein